MCFGVMWQFHFEVIVIQRCLAMMKYITKCVRSSCHRIQVVSVCVQPLVY